MTTCRNRVTGRHLDSRGARSQRRSVWDLARREVGREFDRPPLPHVLSMKLSENHSSDMYTWTWCPNITSVLLFSIGRRVEVDTNCRGFIKIVPPTFWKRFRTNPLPGQCVKQGEGPFSHDPCPYSWPLSFNPPPLLLEFPGMGHRFELKLEFHRGNRTHRAASGRNTSLLQHQGFRPDAARCVRFSRWNSSFRVSLITIHKYVHFINYRDWGPNAPMWQLYLIDEPNSKRFGSCIFHFVQ